MQKKEGIVFEDASNSIYILIEPNIIANIAKMWKYKGDRWANVEDKLFD